MEGNGFRLVGKVCIYFFQDCAKFRGDEQIKQTDDHLVVSKNSGCSPQIILILIGFSIIFTIHFGGNTLIFWKPPNSSFIFPTFSPHVPRSIHSQVYIAIVRIPIIKMVGFSPPTNMEFRPPREAFSQKTR